MDFLNRSLGPVVLVVDLAITTTCVVVAFTAGNDANWWAFVLSQVALGFLVCILAVLRDGYGFREDALIAFKGKDTNVLSIAGALILIPSVIALILGNPMVLRIVFLTTTAIFVFKAAYVELRRWRRRQVAVDAQVPSSRQARDRALP